MTRPVSKRIRLVVAGCGRVTEQHHLPVALRSSLVDVIALGVASKNLRQQINKNVPHSGATRGRVRSFPFISRFVLFGTIAFSLIVLLRHPSG